MSKKLINIGIKAKKAFKIKVDKENKNKVLIKYLQLINKNTKNILKENNKDIKFAIRNNIPENLDHNFLAQLNMLNQFENIDENIDETTSDISSSLESENYKFEKIYIKESVISISSLDRDWVNGTLETPYNFNVKLNEYFFQVKRFF